MSAKTKTRPLAKYSDEQLMIEILNRFSNELDNDGQCVIYTGWYEHSDGRLYPEIEE